MDDYYGPKEKSAKVVALTRSLYLLSAHSGSAGRGALLALHPLLERGFRVADRATQLDVGRAARCADDVASFISSANSITKARNIRVMPAK
jgi:hypothetical protein